MEGIRAAQQIMGRPAQAMVRKLDHHARLLSRGITACYNRHDTICRCSAPNRYVCIKEKNMLGTALLWAGDKPGSRNQNQQAYTTRLKEVCTCQTALATCISTATHSHMHRKRAAACHGAPPGLLRTVNARCTGYCTISGSAQQQWVQFQPVQWPTTMPPRRR